MTTPEHTYHETTHHTTPAGRLRARGLGLTFDGTPGPLNAITDVAGVEVGTITLVEGDGAYRGDGPVRTGVTALLPRGRDGLGDPCAAEMFSLNGNGELTGSHWIAETGLLDSPIALTNTHAVGPVHRGVIDWVIGRLGVGTPDWLLPVVGETWDGYLNDVYGNHVRPEHAVAALDAARPGPVEEGSVGGGTGMQCYGFKGGNGTASRVVELGGEQYGEQYVVGVFLQANFGRRRELTVLGVPVGRHLLDEDPADDPARDPADDPADDPAEPPANERANDPADERAVEPAQDPADDPAEPPANERANDPADERAVEPAQDPADDPAEPPANERANDPADERADERAEPPAEDPADERAEPRAEPAAERPTAYRTGITPAPSASPPGTGSVIVIVATDAPLLAHQCAAMARRVPLGLARTGTTGSHYSGDLFLAFSTANPGRFTNPEADPARAAPDTVAAIPWTWIDPLFEATVQCVEEAVLNALVANETMHGSLGRYLPALPHARLVELLRAHRLSLP